MDEPTDYVLIGGKCYTAGLFHAAMHTVLLERLDATVPDGATPRQMAKAVTALKTPGAHRAIMDEALRRVAASGDDVPLVQAIKDGQGLPIAAFPSSLTS